MQQAKAQPQLKNRLEKTAKMLNFVKIVVKLDYRGFMGGNAHFASVVIADRLL